MAQTIATISLCLCIILLQHLYNWTMRKMWDKLEEDGIGLYAGLTVLMLAINYLIFNTLIEINK